MEDCELCHIINEDYRLIRESEHAFAVICAWPIKDGHIIILPKRHVTQNNFSALSPEEAHDFLTLVEQMQHLLTDKYDEDVILFKNSNSHSSQPHFHMHLMPSKGNMRKLIASYENIPTHPERERGYYTIMKELLTE